jgi:predicted nuclease of predicted toxin-antitoxin system
MKLLIDECLPRDLKRLFSEHECRTVQEMGWSGKQNGELLRLAQQAFDVLITIDQRMEREQSFADLDIALLVLRARSNQIEDLTPLIPAAAGVLSSIQPGQIVRVGD